MNPARADMQFAVATTPSAGKKVALIVLIFGVIALLLQGTIFLQGSVLDGARAYVRGEGLWAKAQKDAVFHLTRYSWSHSEPDYQAFFESVLVTLGDRQARLALAANPPHEEAAREGFLRGRNHPDDVDALIWFYLNFRFVPHVREAIDIWGQADRKIDELMRTGDAIRAEVLGGGAHPREMVRLRDRLQHLNDELLQLEDRFSHVLGAGARWAKVTVWLASLSMFLILLGAGVFISWQIVRGIARAEDQLRLAGTVFDSSTDGVLITDPALAIIAANQTLCDMMGWSAADLRGQTPRVFRSGHTSAELYRDMWRSLNEAGCWQGELLDRTRDGGLLPLRVSISCVKGTKGQTTHYVAIVTDISERKAREEHLNYMAHHDALTGLPNRVLFDDRMEQAFKNALRNRSGFAVLYFDLDEFKPVNDRYGHEVGDQVLKLVAERLTENIRETDTVTRRGGDEFAILLKDVKDRASVDDIRGKIIDAVRAPCRIDGHTIEIGVSVGVALYPDDGIDPEALMRHADHAMYRMKNAAGRPGRATSRADTPRT